MLYNMFSRFASRVNNITLFLLIYIYSWQTNLPLFNQDKRRRPLWWRHGNYPQPFAQRMWISTPTAGVALYRNSFNMLNKKNEAGILLPMTVTEVTVSVLPNHVHEYLMTTKEVAKGYGVTEYAIRKKALSFK